LTLPSSSLFVLHHSIPPKSFCLQSGLSWSAKFRLVCCFRLSTLVGSLSVGLLPLLLLFF
ncbi:MAG: hypothetical protein AAFY76_12950, partial [Cyanobacteria bacterium J06649_11]